MAKTKIQKFLKELEYLKSCIEGVKEPGDLLYDWQFMTTVGIYSVSIHHKPDEKRNELYSIYGCFEEPKRARKVWACNKYSGKYNFHCSDPNECLDRFQTLIQLAGLQELEIDRDYMGKDAI